MWCVKLQKFFWHATSLVRKECTVLATSLQEDTEKVRQEAIRDDLVSKTWFMKNVWTYFFSVAKEGEIKGRFLCKYAASWTHGNGSVLKYSCYGHTQILKKEILD